MPTRILKIAGTFIVAGAMLTGLQFILSGIGYAQITSELHVCPVGCELSSIQTAVDVASAGDAIKVAQGVYHDLNSRDGVTQVVYISKSLSLQGGYTTINWQTPDPLANPTVLDADAHGRVLYITGPISVAIEGLQITGGDANAVITDGSGGGVYIFSATVVFKNNHIVSNVAGYGGGLEIDHGNVSMVNNTIIYNIANSPIASSGGGINVYYGNAELNNNRILSNTAITGIDEYFHGLGGGLFSFRGNLAFAHNLVLSNTAISGGGMLLEVTNGNLANNEIRANTAYGSGGGVELWGRVDYNNYILYLDRSRLNGNIVASNTAQYGGGLLLSLSAATFMNNIIIDNVATQAASGIWIDQSVYPVQLIHTTIARNTGAEGSGVYVPAGGPGVFGTTVELTNTIIASQSVGIQVGSTVANQARLEATLWGTGAWANGQDWYGYGIYTGTHNYWGDPAFINPTAGDYHIGPASTAIGQGIAAGIATDIDGQPRKYQTPDLGADEYWPPGRFKYIYLPSIRR